jgi:hypothetical protein
MQAETPVLWRGADGAPIACRDKLKVLAENFTELRDVAQDAFEDALLMGVDEAAMRKLLHELVDALRPPGAR